MCRKFIILMSCLIVLFPALPLWAQEAQEPPVEDEYTITYPYTPLALEEIDYPESELALLEQEIVRLTNEQRAAAGLPPVLIDEKLMAAARFQSRTLLPSLNYFEYDSLNDGTFTGTVIESIIWSETPEEAIVAWMESPAHRDNILDNNHNVIGAGAYYHLEYGFAFTLIFGHSTLSLEAAPAFAFAEQADFQETPLRVAYMERAVPLNEEPGQRGGFVLRNRAFEIAIGAGVHITNDIFNMSDIFSDVLEIDLQDIIDGFRINFGANFAPLSMNINVRDRWGFGLDIGHVTMTGNFSLPGALLSFQEASDELFGVGGAAFVEFGVPVFFHVRNFRVRVRPALYTPLFHARPGIRYSFDGYRLDMDFRMSIYSALNLGDMFGDEGSGNFNGIPGHAFGGDLSLDVQYPLLYWLNVGVNISNIPIVPSNLRHYARMEGNVFFDTSHLDFGDLRNGNGGLMDDVFGSNMEDLRFGELADGRRVLRPFSMLFYAEARPISGRRFMTVIPSLGFSINGLYPRVFALEGGISTRFDLANMLFATIGINYNDRRWRNSLDFGFNLRAFELGIGISSQSPSFVGSFTGAGVGLDFVMRFGW